MSETSVRVRIEGRVQGVGFRYWVSGEASTRNLAGWVRNRRDGTVEAIFSGATENVQSMQEACWQGPSYARVTSVVSEPCDKPVDAGFSYLPTV